MCTPLKCGTFTRWIDLDGRCQSESVKDVLKRASLSPSNFFRNKYRVRSYVVIAYCVYRQPFSLHEIRLVVLEGSSSDTKPVTPGVHQGTVLGPLLFLVYLNDLPQCVTSSHTRLFADECLIYKEIWSQVDADKLQADLDALQEWEQQWMMSFQLLRITRNNSPVKASYVIHGHILAETDTAKYLGVSLHKHSSCSPHVNATAKKANGTRAFLQRNLCKAPTAVKTRTYESLIRPILEYSGVAQDVNN